MNPIRLRLRRRGLVLLLAAALALVTTGTVLAQATQNFDLGCRAALTSGGGTIVHGSTASTGALGQFAVGETAGANFGVRGGYVQAIPDQTASASLAESSADSVVSGPSKDEQVNSVYVPWLSKAGRILRACQY